MKHCTKRILSFLMVACLLVGLVPMSAAAEGTQAEVKFVAQQLSLSDDLTMKFYVTVDESSAETAAMQIAVSGKTVTQDIKDMPPDENGCYVFSVDLAAAQMTDDITLTMNVGGTVAAQKTYSVQDYAHYLLEGNYTAETKQMVKEMLNYGAKAQTYFTYKTDDLADKGYEIENAAAVPAASESITIEGSVSGISFYGASLIFDSKVAVRYYFKAPNGVAGYTFDGYDVEEKNGLYYVEVPGINPQDYATKVNLTVSNGSDSLVVGYSPLCYITRMYNKADASENLKKLVQAMYGYYLAAVAFTGVEEEEPAPTTTVYYNNDFENNTVAAGDGTTAILDQAGRSFADNNDAYQTITENGNTFLEIQSADSAASQALVWTNTGDTLPSVYEISMKMKVAEGVSFGKDQVTLRYRRGDKNYVFAKMYEQSLTLPTGSGVTPVLTGQM